MGNAAGESSAIGDRAPSQQGLAGLRLQHALPDARVVYVSATGATTVRNLAYAQRLGLWGGDDFPFATRTDLVAAMEEGGIAAMEVLARDLKALGLYAARSLSYEGVEVEMLEHALTPGQIRIYDAYAGAFQVIHRNLDAALKAANVTSETATLNTQAKAAARSAFESNKQRFFNHLITAMKAPTLIRAIEADRAAGKAAIVQLVSTSEALMERRLAEIPAGEWGDLSVDITPREYVLDYLAHGFPTQLHETYTDEEGHLLSRPVFIDGQPVHSREAQERRDRLIEHLAALPPVQGALDQILHHFGAEEVAEVTGRGRRVVRKARLSGTVLCVENRPASSNIAETQAFMDGKKNILVFSDAGGTGRSYHADLSARNRRPRVHYLLEAGWKADAAIQGLGRSNRTNQAQPPLFRPVATDVRGEKRFLSTIARRLDSLGAITRGQRQTGGQGLFRPEDNLESPYARAALRQFYLLLYRGEISGCTLGRFTEATGLALIGQDGTLRDELPPITTFLNRMLALEIAMQNELFAQFEELIAAQVESALAAGTYDAGLETIRAESLAVVSRTIVATHAATGAETRLYAVARKDRNRPLVLQEALELAHTSGGILLANAQSHRAAVQLRAPSLTLDDGTVERRVRLVRPMERASTPADSLAGSHWRQDRPGHLRNPVGARMRRRAGIHREPLSRGDRAAAADLEAPAPGQPARLPLRDRRRRARDRPPRPARARRRAWRPARRSLSRAKPGRRSREAGRSLLPAALPCGAPPSCTPPHRAHRLRRRGGAGLKALGLVSEIIAWRLRLFVPMTGEGPRILARLFERHPPIADDQPPA